MDRSLDLVVARGSKSTDRLQFGVQPEEFRSRRTATVCARRLMDVGDGQWIVNTVFLLQFLLLSAGNKSCIWMSSNPPASLRRSLQYLHSNPPETPTRAQIIRRPSVFLETPFPCKCPFHNVLSVFAFCPSRSQTLWQKCRWRRKIGQKTLRG